MVKTLVFMRTHIITKGVIDEFLKLQNSSEYDCILFIDNHKKIIPDKMLESNDPVQCLNFFNDKVKNVKCFLFDEDIFKSLNLPYYAAKNKNKSLSNVMWYCADYAFYAIKKYFPNYDYYWHFDYDVFCNGSSYEPFFNRYNGTKADLIVSNLASLSIDSDWFWLKKTDWIYSQNKTKYISFFPIVRLSSDAVDFLFAKRIEMSEVFSKICKNKNNRWLNCELFVPTELLNNGFTGLKLDECVRFSPNYDLNEDRVFEVPDNKIYHPVKGNYELSIANLNKKIKNLTKYKLSLFGYDIGFYIVKKR